VHPVALAAIAAGMLLITTIFGRLWPSVLANHSSLALGAVAVAAAAGGALADAAPTGIKVYDVVLRVLIAAGAVLAGARARRWAWLMAAGIAAGASTDAPLDWLAFAALGLAVGCALVRQRGLVVGGLVIGAVVQSVLRLSWPDAQGVNALLGLVALVVVIASGARQSRRVRRWTRRVVIAAGAFTLISGATFALAVFEARSDIRNGLDGAEAGLTAARQGDTTTATAQWEVAARHLGSARDVIDAWWAQPVRLVPIAAQHARALTTLTDASAELATEAAAAARDVDPERLRMRQGRVDTNAITNAVPALDRALAALETAAADLSDVHSSWLVPAVDNALDEFDARVGEAVDEARTAAAIGRVAPALLGGDGLRRWFLVVTSPAELRGSGGFIGNYGELTTDAGALAMPRLGRINELNPGSARNASLRDLGPVATELARYGRFRLDQYFQNATVSPDFPTSARAIEHLYPQSGGQPVNGVVSVDPAGLAALLRLTGPVSVSGWPEPISAENAERVLLFEQYVRFPGAERVDFLETVTEAVFDRLTSIDLPSPGTIGRVLGPAVRGRHIQLHSTRAAEQRVFETIGVSGRMAPVRGDFLALATQNSAESKIDWFLRRAITYRARYDPGRGSVRATAEVRLTNEAPTSGLPPIILGGEGYPDIEPSENLQYLSLYSPLGFDGATLDGEPLLMESDSEAGRNVYSAFVRIPPGATVTLRVRLVGVVPGDRRYRLDVAHQPTVVADRLSVDVRSGKRRLVTANVTLDENRSFVARV
jgi:hypothetical protein